MHCPEYGFPYFDPSVQLAGVQYEYNHKQAVCGTSIIKNILYIAPSLVQLKAVCFVLYRPLELWAGLAWYGYKYVFMPAVLRIQSFFSDPDQCIWILL